MDAPDSYAVHRTAPQSPAQEVVEHQLAIRAEPEQGGLEQGGLEQVYSSHQPPNLYQLVYKFLDNIKVRYCNRLTSLAHPITARVSPTWLTRAASIRRRLV